ncbi:MAG: type II toxin-antitoxin system RelE/ParE family toxin [Pseudomonadota bacterium]
MTLYQVELSFSAREDIQDITHYTFVEYGSKQKDLYVSLLEKGLTTIAENPYIGHAHPDLSDDYQVWKVGKHIVVYTTDDDKSIIYVARILHQNTDIKRQIYGTH